MSSTPAGRITRLRAYLDSTGTQPTWLARQIGVSRSTVIGWSYGQRAMADGYREDVLSVLRERAAISLEGLLDDQIQSQAIGPHASRYESREDQLARSAACDEGNQPKRRSRSGTPFDRMVAAQASPEHTEEERNG